MSKDNAAQFWRQIDRLHQEVDSGIMNPPELALFFTIAHLQNREQGSRWLGARKNTECLAALFDDEEPSSLSTLLLDWGFTIDERLQQRIEGLRDVDDLLTAYQFKGVREDSQQGLHGWLRGIYPLHLRHDIPAPLEMLEAQCEGERFVTLLADKEAQFRPIGRHAGAFEFLLHDLEHANKFFGNEKCFRGQVVFFRHMREALNSGLLNDLTSDERFAKDLAYLISDMNSHPLHLFKYMKAIILEVFKRWGADANEFDELFSSLLDHWRWEKEFRLCAMRINNPGQETPLDAEIFTKYFVESLGTQVVFNSAKEREL